MAVATTAPNYLHSHGTVEVGRARLVAACGATRRALPVRRGLSRLDRHSRQRNQR